MKKIFKRNQKTEIFILPLGVVITRFGSLRSMALVNTSSWLASLSDSERLLYADAYILALQTQLAQAEVRHRRLLKSLGHYDPEDHPDSINGRKILAKRDRYRTCRNCLQTSLKKDVFTCFICHQWGCVKCNTDLKRIEQCMGCYQHICEKCDASVLDDEIDEEVWRCVGCLEARLVVKECKNRMSKLKKGLISRSQAIVSWIVGGFPLDNPENYFRTQDHLLLIDRVLQTTLEEKWDVFLGGCVDEGEADEEILNFFPRKEDDPKPSTVPRGEYCCIVLVPKYRYSPKTIVLVEEIANKVTRKGYEKVFTNKIYGYLAKLLVSSRTTLTVSEVLKYLVDEEYIYQGTVDDIFGKNPEYLQRVFD